MPHISFPALSHFLLFYFLLVPAVGLSEQATFDTYFKAPNADSGDTFGMSIDIDGDLLVIGAPGEESLSAQIDNGQARNDADAVGAAYVFKRDALGSWAIAAYLKAPNAEAGDRFGQNVAISGHTVVVGAPGEDSIATGVNGNMADNSGLNRGAIYVFESDVNDEWFFTDYLKQIESSPTLDGFSLGDFSISMDIDGDVIAVGSQDGVNIYFRDISGNWQTDTVLRPSDIEFGDSFGSAVSVSGATLAVGAPDEDSNAAGVNGDQTNNASSASGAAYVFVQENGGNWIQQAYLKPTFNDANDRFGTDIDLHNELIIVGAPGDDSNSQGVNPSNNNEGFDFGSAYVYSRSLGAWTKIAYLQQFISDAGSGTEQSFGYNVEINDTTIAVSDPVDTSRWIGTNEISSCCGTYAPGVVFTFLINEDGSFSQGDAIPPPSSDYLDFFGIGLALAGTNLYVAAPDEDSASRDLNSGLDDNNADRSGAAYSFSTQGRLISGDVIGLQGIGLALQNNGVDSLEVTSEGGFVFSEALVDGSSYAVTVATQPTDLSQTCTVTNGSGTLAGADVTNIQVDCVTDTFTVGGSVSGLAGTGLVLQNNGGDDLLVSADGGFTFPAALADGSSYAVTVATQPTDLSQTCAVTNGSGTLAGADVTNIQVDCVTDTFTVGGSVSGLAGTGLVLQNNGGDDLLVSADGGFTFPTALTDGSAYDVTVATQPTDLSQTCTLTNGSGTLAGADVTNVQVVCVTDTFTVGGAVTGVAGTGLVLQNNAGDDLPINAEGAFTFPTALTDGSAYDVTVATQPTDLSQTCSVTNGSGTLASAGVTNIQVDCVTDTFSVGGSVSGLAGTGLVLQNNAGDDLLVAADGGFTFPAALADGSSYAVTVATQPTDLSQTCSVTNGSGTLAGADVTNVQVDCVTDSFTVGGAVTGLEADQVVLQNNGGDDQVLTADGGFTFAAQDDGTSYNITVAIQPTNLSQTCSVTNGSGMLAGADITDVQVDCVTDTFTVGGAVTGLEGDQVVLQNNGGDDQVVTADGGFTFTSQDDGTSYNIAVATQPNDPSQTCTVTNGSGTLAGAEVTDVQVDCVAEAFTIGGMVSGLQGAGLVLQNNGGDALSISADGAFIFPTALKDGSSYSVTVSSRPIDPKQVCSITNGEGNLLSGPVDDIAVGCLRGYSVGGSVSGLRSPGLVIDLNNKSALLLEQDADFTFPLWLTTAENWGIQIIIEPDAHTCTASPESGVTGGSDIEGVAVECSTDILFHGNFEDLASDPIIVD